ncbi:hypothetical protein [Aestuariivirga sp.]|uniref:hypothetical protein n=1 Tax=Aestuariivirga sp. TaxID=2650926 RepID=UPI0039E5DA14
MCNVKMFRKSYPALSVVVAAALCVSWGNCSTAAELENPVVGVLERPLQIGAEQARAIELALNAARQSGKRIDQYSVLQLRQDKQRVSITFIPKMSGNLEQDKNILIGPFVVTIDTKAMKVISVRDVGLD